jgi:hypothetical protein
LIGLPPIIASTTGREQVRLMLLPPKFAGWLEVLRDESRDGSNEWEDTLHAVTDYFGLSTDN